MSDAPTPAELNRIVVGVFDRAAASYESVGIEYFSVFGRWLVDAATLRDGERVLDVGAGRGAVTIPAAPGAARVRAPAAARWAHRAVHLRRRRRALDVGA
jgi:2-polyprenyl-3-methyl-5-hydroxy-6-metoxy-1,4-benzoquinol methylase